MKAKKIVLAKGYRVQKINVKDLIKSVLTLGIKKYKVENEEAKTYLYQIEDTQVIISEEFKHEQYKKMKKIELESVDEKQKLLTKGKFTDETHVYYLDKDSIKEKE